MKEWDFTVPRGKPRRKKPVRPTPNLSIVWVTVVLPNEKEKIRVKMGRPLDQKIQDIDIGVDMLQKQELNY